MNEYVFMATLASGSALGLLGGMATAIFFLSINGNKKKPAHAGKKKGDSSFLKKKNIDLTKKEKRNLLQKRLKKEKTSWTDFTCMADNKDTAGHIRRSRKKENRAYEYLKRKAEK